MFEIEKRPMFASSGTMFDEIINQLNELHLRTQSLVTCTLLFDPNNTFYHRLSIK